MGGKFIANHCHRGHIRGVAKVRNRRYIYGNTYLHDASFDYHANPRSILVARLFVVAIYITLSAAGVKIFIGCGVAQLAGAGIYRAVG